MLCLVLSNPSDGYCTDNYTDWRADDPTWPYCYKQFTQENIPWANANDSCVVNEGGSLIVIHNEAVQNAMVNNAIPVPSWLGMTNNNPKGNIYIRLCLTYHIAMLTINLTKSYAFLQFHMCIQNQTLIVFGNGWMDLN